MRIVYISKFLPQKNDFSFYMKKYIALTSFLFLFDFLSAKAQDVYNLVLNNATRIVNNPTSNYTQTQISQFKRTALIYMKSKAFEGLDSISSSFLDTQAYYLSEFITLFFNDVVKSKRLNEEKRKERIMMFTDASISNPMFADPDKDTTLAFIKNGGELTPFSIDTDWQKAYAAAMAQLKKK